MTDNERILALKAKMRPGMYSYEKYAINRQIRAIRLAAAKAKGTHTETEWIAVLEKYEYRCVCCGCTPEGRPCKDHILPIYQGGSDGLDNLQPLCRQCNSAKGRDAFNWAAYRDQHGFGDAPYA